jgi:hypothetical protein
VVQKKCLLLKLPTTAYCLLPTAVYFLSLLLLLVAHGAAARTDLMTYAPRGALWRWSVVCVLCFVLCADVYSRPCGPEPLEPQYIGLVPLGIYGCSTHTTSTQPLYQAPGVGESRRSGQTSGALSHSLAGNWPSGGSVIAFNVFPTARAP